MAIMESYTFNHRFEVDEALAAGALVGEGNSATRFGAAPKLDMGNGYLRVSGAPDRRHLIQRILGRSPAEVAERALVPKTLLGLTRAGDIIRAWRHANGAVGLTVSRDESIVWAFGEFPEILSDMGISYERAAAGLVVQSGAGSLRLDAQGQQVQTETHQLVLVEPREWPSLSGCSSSIGVLRKEEFVLIRQDDPLLLFFEFRFWENES